ncbi:MAG TPA: DUF6036 family nucleotidyltransferase [Candidatus Binatia bacterium]|nr:DUF6036 family nucleotidyltransferase [Candidatus Binatia bacterium]
MPTRKAITESFHVILYDMSEVKESIKRAELPSNSYIIIGGASLVLRGIKRTTADVDVLVPDALFKSLLDRPHATSRGALIELEIEPFELPTVQAIPGYKEPVPVFYDDLQDRVEQVNDCPCAPLSIVRASKEALHRHKDLEDIASIEHFGLCL